MMLNDYAMELTSIMVIVCSVVVSVRGQIVSCKASVNCAGGAGDDLGVAASRESCCMDNSRALAYNTVGTEECVACIVVGFLNASFSGVEQGPGHNVPVGYLKGGTLAGQDLVFDVKNTPGTAREGSQFDYTVNTLRVRALLNGQIQNVVLTFRVDAIAQESNETFTLTLNPLVAPTPRVGLFFRNTIQVTIVDSDNVEFAFTEDDFRDIEPDLANPVTFLPVLVFKSTRIASRVELVVVPLMVDEARATSIPLPPNVPVDDTHSPPFADLNDFNNTNITLVFEPDEDVEVNEMSAPIFVTDDAINEATQQVFVAELILVSSIDPATVDLTIRPSTLCIIIDNDPIRIGFELPGYTYTEPQFEEFIDKLYVSPTGRPENGPVFLVKEDNVTTEQTFLLSVQVMDIAPSGTSIQSATIDQDYCICTPLSGGMVKTNVTRTFPARDQKIPFGFTLIPDTLPEGTEAFQARVSLKDSRLLPERTEERFPNMALNPEGLASEIFVVIEDDDQLVFGFSATEYEVHENDGSITVEIFSIHGILGDYQPIVLISTHNGTAIEGADFSAITSSQVTFSAGNRIKSLTIPIISNNSTEGIEEFTVTLDKVILIHTNDSSMLNLSEEGRPGLMLSPRVASITILDDNMAVIGFLNTNPTVFEGEGELNFTIGVLQGYLDTIVTILFMTEASTAKASLDYIETSKFLNFTGDSVQTVSIQIIDDGISEPSETFFGLLSSANGTLIPPNIHLEPNRATATIINENGSNSIVTALVVVPALVCTLVFFTLIMTVLYFLLKKKNKRKTNPPGHVRDSVSPPPNRLSEPIYPNLNTLNLS